MVQAYRNGAASPPACSTGSSGALAIAAATWRRPRISHLREAARPSPEAEVDRLRPVPRTVCAAVRRRTAPDRRCAPRRSGQAAGLSEHVGASPRARRLPHRERPEPRGTRTRGGPHLSAGNGWRSRATLGAIALHENGRSSRTAQGAQTISDLERATVAGSGDKRHNAPDGARKALSPAKERLLLDALRSHPGPVKISSPRVGAALQAAGLLTINGALTAAGLDVAARLSAQNVIDAVNARRAASSMQAPAARPRPTPPGGITPSERASSKPPDWPFPESHHSW
ncbi:MAG: hypothetical protein JWP60_2985 [Ramlibacter sp.]|nr:hypothetical protein [Ramlibacter sp.]